MHFSGSTLCCNSVAHYPAARVFGGTLISIMSLLENVEIHELPLHDEKMVFCAPCVRAE
jgi:hypothetical protein